MATFSGVGRPAAAAPSPAMIDANAYSIRASKLLDASCVMEGGTVRRRCGKRETADRRRIWKRAWASSIGTRVFTSSAGSPLAASLTKSRLNYSVPTDIPTTLIPCPTTVGPMLSTARRCSSMRSFGRTPFASSACDFFRLREMPSTPQPFLKPFGDYSYRRHVEVKVRRQTDSDVVNE